MTRAGLLAPAAQTQPAQLATGACAEGGLFRGGGATLHARYVSTVSGPGADTDRIHCIWAEIQLVQYVLYLIVSEVEADTDCIHRIIQ